MNLKSKPTNKELLNMAIYDELLIFGNWLLKNTNTYKFYNESGIRLPMKDILEMYKKETK